MVLFDVKLLYFNQLSKIIKHQQKYYHRLSVCQKHLRHLLPIIMKQQSQTPSGLHPKQTAKIKYKQKNTFASFNLVSPHINRNNNELQFSQHPHSQQTHNQTPIKQNLDTSKNKYQKCHKNTYKMPQQQQTIQSSTQKQRPQNKNADHSSHKLKLSNLRLINSTTKQQVLLLKARLNKLKQQHKRNKRRTIKSYQQIDRMLSNKYNSIDKQRNKSMYYQKIKNQVEQKKEFAKNYKNQLKQELNMSRNRKFIEKSSLAQIIRKNKNIQQEQIKVQRKKSLQLNTSRAKTIRLYEIQHKNHMNLLTQSSLVKGKSNHNQKVSKYLKQKQMLRKTMKMLKSQQNNLLQQLMAENQELREVQEQIQAIKISTKRQEFQKRENRRNCAFDSNNNK